MWGSNYPGSNFLQGQLSGHREFIMDDCSKYVMVYFGVLYTEAYSEPCETSKKERFALTIFAKRSVINVWKGSENASAMVINRL